MFELFMLYVVNRVVPDILNNLIYDACKAGAKKVFRLDSKETLQRVLSNEAFGLRANQEMTNLLVGQVLNNQAEIAKCLSAVTKKLDMETTVTFDKEHYTISVSPNDHVHLEKLNTKTPLAIAEHSAAVSVLGFSEEDVLAMSKELELLKNDVEVMAEKIKNVLITPEKAVEPNPIFREALLRKTKQKMLVYEVPKNGFYAFSRAKTRTELSAYPQFYISNKRGENISKAVCSDRLSDANNIVFKVDIGSGYIFAISEKVVL